MISLSYAMISLNNLERGRLENKMPYMKVCLYCDYALGETGPEIYFCDNLCGKEWLKQKLATISLNECMDIMSRLETLCTKPTKEVAKARAKAAATERS